MFKTSVMNAVQSVKAHSGVRRWRTRVLIQSGQTLLSRPHFRQRPQQWKQPEHTEEAGMPAARGRCQGCPAIQYLRACCGCPADGSMTFSSGYCINAAYQPASSLSPAPYMTAASPGSPVCAAHEGVIPPAISSGRPQMSSGHNVKNKRLLHFHA